MSKAVAIIPARGGSKRIPQKNIRPFLGVPIIKYSIDAALASGCFTEVMVSTDDREIAALAKSFGADIPFFRSEETSNDHATLADVVAEVMMRYQEMGSHYDFFCCLLPTAPFVSGARLRAGFHLLRDADVDAVIPVVRFDYPIQRALKNDGGFLKMIWPENRGVRSQDLEPSYHDSGQFYWMRTAPFLAQRQLFAERTLPMEIPGAEVQDIDSEEDWLMAEIKYQFLQSRRDEEGRFGAGQQ